MPNDRKLALARQYRPQNFSQLVGQDTMVQVLKNAFKQGRIAQAYILTGVRGVGKTTTARIIAKALNCEENKQGILNDPCGICENCKAITEDRHIDVMEMDAATHTKVEEMRELLASVSYSPSLGRYKIYILDEVHMLSTSSFNAMLKTLEEPPPHVVFLFATTEIRKVPLTILSRCQRFDLRRVSVKELTQLYSDICSKENITIDDGALTIIATAADGSVRDGLSILDQAIALSDGHVSTEGVTGMLGLNDRSKIWQLLILLCEGKAEELCQLYNELTNFGADPRHIIQDIMEAVHLLSKASLLKSVDKLLSAGEIDKKYCGDYMGKITIADTSRMWQILMKSLPELLQAPNPIIAGEMILLRLLCAGNTPSPLELIKRVQYQNSTGLAPAGGPIVSASAPTTTHARANNIGPTGNNPPADEYRAYYDDGMARQYDNQPQTAQSPIIINDLAGLVALARQCSEFILASNIENMVHCITMRAGLLEFRPADKAPQNLAQEIKAFLNRQTGENWVVMLGRAEGAPTLRTQKIIAEQEFIKNIQENDEIMAQIVQLFPKSKIISID